MTDKKIMFGLLLGALCLAACGSEKTDSLTLSGTGRLAAHVKGWTEQTDKFRFFTARQLYDIIDGGAAEYEKSGLVDGVVVSLSAKPERSAEIYVENFKSPARASAMVLAKRKNASDPKPVSEVQNKLAFYDEVIGGCVVYSAKGAFYFEMTLTGYENGNAAARDAKRFIDAFEKDLRK